MSRRYGLGSTTVASQIMNTTNKAYSATVLIMTRHPALPAATHLWTPADPGPPLVFRLALFSGKHLAYPPHPPPRKPQAPAPAPAPRAR